MSAEPAKTLYLGIDGGGTKTRAVVVNSTGAELGAGEAGPCNYKNIGVEAAAANLRAAAAKAGCAAGHSGPYASAWIGAAGVDGAADLALLAPAVASLATTVRLTNDAELLLAALPNQTGVALIAGTGSIAVGRNAAGAAARTGGWGRQLGDEGSGYTVGQQALIAALRCADGRGQSTQLYKRICAVWNVANAEEMADRVYQDEGAVASLAPLTLQIARDGDQVAGVIVQQAVTDLATMVSALASQLGFSDMRLNLALGGSLLLRDEDYRTRVVQQILTHCALGAIVLVDQPALAAARAATTL
jgi:N-acetylglucosamine kinase-like BadF-type ATPase